ncbi:transcription termination/antitermination NusG family protein [Sphingomonas sp.]|uniref:transcription termination/antitermination NusG family protein n=1 Tax=Sphingomonas sp. TaxID=28214 RepID=UPI003B0089A5
MGKADTRYGDASKGSPDVRDARLADVRRRRRERDGEGWCIVRTNSRRTLTLAASLNRAGIEAWTPEQTVRHRLPRRKAYREQQAPIVPSFVFVRASHLHDLLRALALPINPHPAFSIFQHAGRAPVVADREIGHLQAAEDRARRAMLKTKRHTVQVGSEVHPTEGAFAGLHGVVDRVSGNDAEVVFNDTFRVKIASWLLIGDDVNAGAAPSGAAALAA